MYCWIAIRYMEPCNFVIPIVLKALNAGYRAKRRIERGRGVPSFRKHTNRLIRRIAVIGPDVEHENGIEGVPLGMERITGVFDEHNFIRHHKGDVIKPTMRDIALIKHREFALVA